MRIKITKDGPYLVTGGIPLKEMIITPVHNHYELREGRSLPQSDRYALCRCGQSANAPFCDGAHVKAGFSRPETASKTPYLKRVTDVVEGSEINLLDDQRCAFARFCHTEQGMIWDIAEQDDKPGNRAAAIAAAKECPTGRLVVTDKSGKVLEEDFAPEIIILQDPEQGASAGIFVKGPVVVEGADGTEYEVRNRVALCRCGKSSDIPFCDASHVPFAYNDGHLAKAALK